MGRTTMSVPPATTWEAVARRRLEAVCSPDELQGFMGARRYRYAYMYSSSEHVASDRAGAAVSAQVLP